MAQAAPRAPIYVCLSPVEHKLPAATGKAQQPELTEETSYTNTVSRVNSASLDKAHSLALLLAAARTGHVSFDVASDDTGSEVARLLRSAGRSVGRYRRRALTTAVIFDTLDLWGLPRQLNVDRLTEDGLVRMTWRRGDYMLPSDAEALALSGVEDERTIGHVPSGWIASMKSVLMPSIQSEQTAQARISPNLAASDYSLSAAYDVAAEIAREGGDLRALRHDLWSMLVDDFDNLRAPILSSGSLQHLVGHLGEAGRDRMEAAPALLAVCEVLPETWQMFFYSTAFNFPLVTRSRFPSEELAPVHALEDSFALCQIAMRELVPYVPIVDDFDDVLRLRGHPAISRLRQLLAEWAGELATEDVRSLEVLRDDVRRASEQLQRLPKWRKADEAMFWLQVPLAFVPLIGVLFTVLTVATGATVRHIERRHAWVAIGMETPRGA
jgi:hypothetical protein